MADGPHATAAAVSRRHLTRLLLVAVLTLLAFALRMPDRLRHPQWWAEDGALFYPDAERLGVRAIVTPYSGYLLVVPRAVSVVGAQVPVFYLPGLYAAAAGLVAVLTLAVVAEAGLATQPGTNLGLVGAALLAPFSGEVWLTLTNVQWLGGLLVLVLIGGRRPPTRLGQAFAIGACTVSGVTGPFTVVFLPLAAWRALWHRDRYSMALLTASALTAAVTVGTLLAHGRVSTAMVAASPTAAGGTRVALLGAACLFFIALVGFAVRRRDWPIVTVAAGGALAIAAVMTGLPADLVAGLPYTGGRYLFVPWCAGAWTLLLLLERGHRLALVPLVAAAVFAALWFRIPALVRYDWERDARCLQSHVGCLVTINPGWRMALPGRGTAPFVADQPPTSSGS